MDVPYISQHLCAYQGRMWACSQSNSCTRARNSSTRPTSGWTCHWLSSIKWCGCSNPWRAGNHSTWCARSHPRSRCLTVNETYDWLSLGQNSKAIIELPIEKLPSCQFSPHQVSCWCNHQGWETCSNRSQQLKYDDQKCLTPGYSQALSQNDRCPYVRHN